MAKLKMVKDGHLGGYVHGGDPGTWCPHLWTWVVRRFQVRSVLDVGCGEGHATRFFGNLGCAVTGVEGCSQAIRDSVIPGCVVQHDFCHGPYLPPTPPDLIWSCEFLEHVEEKYLGNILQTFAEARKLIFVTHAFPGQDDGHHHVNCRPSSYWIRRIEGLGLRCDAGLSREARTVTLRDYAGVNHFARSGLVFVRDAIDRDRQEAAASSSGQTWQRWRGLMRAQWNAVSVNFGFAMSPALRAHRRQRRALKRAVRRDKFRA